MVAFVAVADVNMVRTESIHLLVHQLNEVITGMTYDLEMITGECIFQDKVSFIAILTSLFLCDDDFHACVVVKRTVSATSNGGVAILPSCYSLSGR